jgi:iron complex outermembrane receptor protein
MLNIKYIVLVIAICASFAATPSDATVFNVPGGSLETALDAYSLQSGIKLLVPSDQLKGVRSSGAVGDLAPPEALSRILSGTGFVARRDNSGVMGIVRDRRSETPANTVPSARLAEAASGSASLETVTVTSSKIGGDVQNIPIAITALSQEQLTATQTTGGPDLIKEVPNMTFTKTNFSGYSIQIRGIGTQAISVTTDPAVAVAFNDIPFLRNHFFEQEFYDVSQVEVLRGPQGTLYGRNSTAGVVNLISAKPSDQFEAMASADFGNYQNRRFEGMMNIPVVDDRLDIRVAGEWTKRDGYSFNDISNTSIDGRDLWSSRTTLGWKPTPNIQTYLVWEHFSEDDDRIRSSKQLCTPVPTPTEFEGIPVGIALVGNTNGQWLSQGCSDGSVYSPAAFGVPDGFTLPFWAALNYYVEGLPNGMNPYAGATQSTNLRVISSQLNPTYRAKNDTLEFNGDWRLTPSLIFTSQTGYNNDFLWSTEDYNRFATRPDVFDWAYAKQLTQYIPGTDVGDDMFCDPQLGCANRLEAEDLSDEHAWQFSQEFRLASNFNGPLNFSVGGNYLHYETEENYYVFINTLTLISVYKMTNWPAQDLPYQAGVSTSSWCLSQANQYGPGGGSPFACNYIDPNPLSSLNNQGHNYFLSQNPYVLNSYAGFGEAYYNVLRDFKLTAGLRWTDDQKHFTNIPSELLTPGYGYLVSGVTNQQWGALTGRLVANWTPDLDFTDKTLIYFSAAHGYKAGGANPPGAQLLTYDAGDIANPIHPTTFKPEYIQAFELGSKNTLLDGSVTLNGDAFYYDYTGYQISEIVDRTAINNNFNATVKGAELETTWEPLPGLKFVANGGYEDTRLDNGSQSVDLLDRTAGNPNWVVVKPFLTQASNCILPVYVVVATMLHDDIQYECGNAYNNHWDPVTQAPYTLNPSGVIVNDQGNPICPGSFGCGAQYPGFDPLAGAPGDPYTGQNTFNAVDYGPAPNNGQGFDKNLSGHQLPNAPHFTISLSAEYTMPVSPDWAATLHTDFYWQSQQWARVFEDPIDRIKGYSTTNVLLILTNQNGWQVMGYVKNVFNVTAITGTFLNSDDTDLTTNVFLTDPRLIGIRVTKNW